MHFPHEGEALVCAASAAPAAVDGYWMVSWVLVAAAYFGLLLVGLFFLIRTWLGLRRGESERP